MSAENVKDSRRLDFVIVGTQKGGTTALDYYLRQNPSVQMGNNRKELHFFDNDSLYSRRENYEAYHAHFEWGSKTCVRGEATPVYMYLPQCIERIRAYNPDIRLVCLLRNPAFRAYSHWRMERARGREILPFSIAIREGRERLRTNPGSLQVHDYVERGFYSPQVARLLSHFDCKQILFLTSDFLKRSFSLALSRLANFVGAEPFHNIVQRYISPVADRTPYDVVSADIAYLTCLFRDDILRTMELSAIDLTAWLDPAYTEFKIRHEP